jgi:diphthamide synthase (EF-2-diphthine--ammonia ligase)
MLHGNLDDLDDVVDILFWSGGKDSYLALRTLARQAPGPASVLLLTTYDARSRTVAHQEVPVADVARQAAALRLALLGVPLGGDDYAVHLRRAIDHVRAQGIRIARIAFGDLHLAHIRAWRDEHLADVAPAGAELYYPLWRHSYAELRRELEASGVTARICAVARQDMCRGTVAVGDLFDGHLAKRLPSDVDPFGENGEFHSIVEVWEDDPHVLPWNTPSKEQPSTPGPQGEPKPCDRALLL